jgi:hypothetical protein
MSAPMKCPNPHCSFLFDPRQVPPGATLACPMCRMQFTLPPLPTAYLPPNPGMPPAPAPVPQSPAPTGGLRFESEEEADEEPRTASAKSRTKTGTRGKLVRPPTRGSKNGSPAILIVGGVVGTIVVCAVLGTLLFFYKRGQSTTVEPGKELKYEKYQVGYTFPKSLAGWEKDIGNNSGKGRLDASMLGFRKRSGENSLGWVVFHAKNFEATPGEPELRTLTVETLRRTFEEIPDELETTPDSLMGLKALRMTFRGIYSETNETCAGEVYIAANKGTVYWAYAWGPEQTVNSLADDFATIRGGLKLLTSAATTNEPKPIAKEYRGSGAAYKLFVVTDHEGLWKFDRNIDPKTRDPKAELYLDASFVRRANTPPTVELAVCLLANGADPKTTAEDHIKMQLPVSETPPEIDVVEGEPTGEAPKITNIEPKSPVTRLRARYRGADNTVHRFVVYATLPPGQDQTVMAYAICPLKDKEKWEQRMMLIVGSLRKP